MKWLILGGTSEAMAVAQRLCELAKQGVGIEVNYSVAGLVRQPKLPCTVISGGFSQYGGMEQFIKDHNITGLLDLTHPFAQGISTAAVNAASASNIPCWRYLRSDWQAQAGDQWHFYSDWNALVRASLDYSSLFISVGQLTQNQMDFLLAQRGQVNTHKVNAHKIVIRTAVEPKIAVPKGVSWITEIGPFTLDDELALLQNYQIDALLCKHSGGSSTRAKLDAARQCDLPVLMLQRPSLPAATQEFHEVEALISAVENSLKKVKVN